MPTIRELEDLIIDAIYQDVITGKLDQKEQQFEVEYIIGRDLEPGKIESILVALKTWFVTFVYHIVCVCVCADLVSRANTTSSVLSALDEKLTSLAACAVAKHKQDEEYDRELAATIKNVAEKQKEARLSTKREPSKLSLGGKLEKDRDVMDIDEPVENRGKNRK
jgi:COP9 signalosome complex subunit 7